MKTADPITNLINSLSKLPGIGERTASRLAFYILNQPDELATDLAEALTSVKERIGLCKRCCNLTDGDYCTICANPKRDSYRDLRGREHAGSASGGEHGGVPGGPTTCSTG